MALMVLEAVGFLEPMPFIMAEMVVLIGIDDRENRHIRLGEMGPEFFTGYPVVPKTGYLRDSILQCKDQKCKTSAMIVSWPFEGQVVASLFLIRGRGFAVIIKTAEVSAQGEKYSGIVQLTLTEESDGWTYRVEGMRDNQFTLTWRARTPEGASRKLQDVYDPQVWQLTIKETA